jgi:hypothetical protein
MNRDTVLVQWKEMIESMKVAYVTRRGHGDAADDHLQRSIELVRKSPKNDQALKPADISTTTGEWLT